MAMQKRGMVIGNYDTAARLWTLTGWTLSDPAQVTSLLDIPGRRKGPLDLSTANTDGDPVYGSRTLEATFETSEGDRPEREERISYMVNALDGYELEITLPDDPHRFIVGRVSVKRIYNDMTHASVAVAATCEPWRYSAAETVVVLVAETASKSAMLVNTGRLAVVPTLTVSGGDVRLVVGNTSKAMSPGTYIMPDLLLPKGGVAITYSGTGTLVVTYREGVL